VSRTPSKESRATAAREERARARAMGVELGSLEGTGPDGRVTHGDLDAFLTSTTAAPARPTTATGDDSVDDVKVTGLRRNIAERMQASKRRIPHFTYVEEVDVTEVERLRRELNGAKTERQPKLSLLPFLMRAVVAAVRAHPAMNARFDDEERVVRRHRAVHLGSAVQTDRGLMVPVVKQAGDFDIWASAADVTRRSAAARTAKITLDEVVGSTITIKSLGALGGIASTPVINAPEVAIVGVNKIVDRPVYVGDVLVRRQLMNLSSSFDHRVIDGAGAATSSGLSGGSSRHRRRRSAARTADGLLSGGRVGESFGVAEADVDGQVGEDVRHLGSISELHGPAGAGTVEHPGRVGLDDTR